MLVVKFIQVLWKTTYFKHILVGGFNPSEKYESQIGSSSQLLGKIKAMFQTSNQNP
jgi:hypothetical protein